MSNGTDKNENNPFEVFVGTPWEVALVSKPAGKRGKLVPMLYYGGREQWLLGTPRAASRLNRIMVSSEDYERAKGGC